MRVCLALAVVAQIKIAHDMQMSNFVQIAQYYSRTFSNVTVCYVECILYLRVGSKWLFDLPPSSLSLAPQEIEVLCVSTSCGALGVRSTDVVSSSLTMTVSPEQMRS